ncbi:MAG: hypothetical protein LBT11_00530 [Treponema sp.]|nr:hypothetical protein [Treponema sp.]
MKKAFCIVAVFFGVLCAVQAQWETEQVKGGLVITSSGTVVTIPASINGNYNSIAYGCPSQKASV